jgi:EF hand
MLLCSLLAAEVPKTTAKPADTTDPRKFALLKRIMTAADKNKDGRLSIAEFKTLDVQALHHGPEHFEQGDTNQDGFIDSDELPGSLRKQTWFAILSEGTEACFKRLDSRQDAKLDVKEFRLVSKMGAHTEQHFRGADSDKDGFLSVAELGGLAERKLKALEDASPKKK